MEIFIDGRDVALVRPGDQARIQFEGWPAVQFSGWPSVAVGTFGGRVTTIVSNNSNFVKGAPGEPVACIAKHRGGGGVRHGSGGRRRRYV